MYYDSILLFGDSFIWGFCLQYFSFGQVVNNNKWKPLKLFLSTVNFLHKKHYLDRDLLAFLHICTQLLMSTTLKRRESQFLSVTCRRNLHTTNGDPKHNFQSLKSLPFLLFKLVIRRLCLKSSTMIWSFFLLSCVTCLSSRLYIFLRRRWSDSRDCLIVLDRLWWLRRWWELIINISAKFGWIRTSLPTHSKLFSWIKDIFLCQSTISSKLGALNLKILLFFSINSLIKEPSPQL